MSFDEEELDPHGECAHEIASLRARLAAAEKALADERAERIRAVSGMELDIAHAEADRDRAVVRADAAEARQARLVGAGQAAIAAVVWKDGYCPHCSTLPEHCHTHKPECPIGALARAALAADGSALAQAIEGVLHAWRTEELPGEWAKALDALRRAWGQR